MGHEFMEMKNTSAAIQAYRQAIGISFAVYFALIVRDWLSYFLFYFCALLIGELCTLSESKHS